MGLENVIVISMEDKASSNIKKFLLELGDWKDHLNFDDSRSYTLGNTVMVTIESIHLYYDNIDKKVEDHFGFVPDLIIYASRHRSESGLKTLTVHPLGNFTDAKFGGIPGKLVPSAPRKMTQALRILASSGRELEHKISYEATHHGPYLETPTFFIEIGSDEKAWVEDAPARVLAKTILKVISERPDPRDKVGLGIGGGHYVPRLTEVALMKHVAFGHMVPKYASEIPFEKFKTAINATPDVECVYFHKKYLKKSRYRELKQWFENETHLEVVDSKSLESIEND